jgi:hypothetical protein
MANARVCHILVRPDHTWSAVSSRLCVRGAQYYVLLEADPMFSWSALVEIHPAQLRRALFYIPDLFLYEGEVLDPRGRRSCQADGSTAGN